MTAGPYVECSKCGDRIRSEHRHDWRPCKCGQTFVDGGSDYLRVGGYPIIKNGRITRFRSAKGTAQ